MQAQFSSSTTAMRRVGSCRASAAGRQAQAIRPFAPARPGSGPLHSAPRSRSAATRATVKDDNTGAEFQLVQKFWEGEEQRCLGAGTRVKKILLLNVKVYSVAAYVEADRCAKELGVRSRGGFFENDDDFTSALLDGAFNKALLVRLVRDVDGQQFADALNESLVARMTLAGELDKLNQFKALFDNKKLAAGTEVALFWSAAGAALDVRVSPAAPADYHTLTPELRISSLGLCRGLFEVFLGGSSVVPEARKLWAQGAKALLESENVKRASRKA